MKFYVMKKSETDIFYQVSYCQRADETRYNGVFVVSLHKDAVFSNGINNRVWFDNIRIDDEWELKGPVHNERSEPGK